MKKIIYTIVFCCFMSFAMAEIDFSQAISTTTMPTDAEIRATIAKFNFTPEQQEAIFKDTKKRLQEMYSSKNPSEFNQELNKNYEFMNQVPDELMNSSVKQETKKEVSKYRTVIPDDGLTIIK